MTDDTAGLIARAREEGYDLSEMGSSLIAALEATEKRGEEESERLHRAEQGWADEARRAEAAEAQRDALAKAILAALNELAVKEARAAVPLINEKVRERDAALVERDALQGDVDKLVGKIGGLTGENRRLREAANAVLSEVERLNEAERMDRESGFPPIPGESALYVLLALRIADLRAALAAGSGQ